MGGGWLVSADIAGAWLAQRRFYQHPGIALIVLLFGRRYIPETRSDTPSRIDWQGAGLLALALGCLLFSISRWGQKPAVGNAYAAGRLTCFIWHVPQCPTPAASGRSNLCCRLLQLRGEFQYSGRTSVVFSSTLVRIPVLHGADD